MIYDVIFLDIDGVLTRPVNDLGRNDEYVKDQEDLISNKCVDLLKYITNNTEAKIVISSIWRLRYEVEDFKRLFNEKSTNRWDAPVIDKVRERSYRRGEIRGDLVQEWIDNNGVNNYVILDDDSDFYEYQPLIYIKETDDLGGLENIDVNRIVNVLKGGCRHE